MNSKIVQYFIFLWMIISCITVEGQKKSGWIAASSANSLKNPIAGNAASLKEAKTIYSTTCSPCHGEKGRGNGAASAALDPKPADHSSAATQAQTDGAIYWKLTEGRNPMPSYKAMLTDAQRWGLVNYIRTLKR